MAGSSNTSPLRILPWSLLLATAAATTSTSKASTESSTHATTPASHTSSGSPSGNDTYLTLALTPNSYNQYNVQLTAGASSSMALRIDYLKPDVVFIDSRSMLGCDKYLSYASEYVSKSTWPSYVTEDSQTYDLEGCYINGGWAPVATTTTVSGSATETVTITTVTDTTSSFETTYPDDTSAVGYVLQSNLTFNLQDDKTLTLPDFEFLLAEDSNLYGGILGLLDNGQSSNFLAELQQENKTRGQGYSTFFFYDSNATSSLAGYLLPGSVDSRFWSGDFYSFPKIDYTGTFPDGHNLPIFPLDDVTLVNEDNGNTISLNKKETFPVLLDSSAYFSYLPIDIMVNLALQLNAYYSSDDGAWLVGCNDIEESNASILFDFGPLTVNLSLSDILMDGYGSGDGTLKFNNGEEVCFLNLLSNEGVGYSLLGNSFFKNIYLAMDNEGGRAGMANSNKDLKIPDEGSSLGGGKSNSAGFITSDYIPFASTVNATQNFTLTYSEYNASKEASIPAGLSNIQIKSGYVYITNAYSSTDSDSATAANARPSSGGNMNSVPVPMQMSVLYTILLVGGMMGILFV